MNPIYVAYLYLTAAIICELIGTTLLNKSEQFSKLIPTAFMAVFFVTSLYCLSQSLKVVPLGIAYAIWAGVGIVATAIIGVVIFNQKIDVPAMTGIAFIVTGVIIINMFSKTSGH